MKPEVLERRAQWKARFHAGWLAHYEQTGEIDWERYNRPRNEHGISGPGIELRASRLMFISSASCISMSRSPGFNFPLRIASLISSNAWFISVGRFCFEKTRAISSPLSEYQYNPR